MPKAIVLYTIAEAIAKIGISKPRIWQILAKHPTLGRKLYGRRLFTAADIRKIDRLRGKPGNPTFGTPDSPTAKKKQTA